MTSSGTATRQVPNNDLKDLVGGDLPESNPVLIAAANSQLSLLSNKFQDWLDKEVQRLNEALSGYMQKNDKEQIISVHDCSHDIKGLATTFGYPLVGRLAASLCRLTFSVSEGGRFPPQQLVKAHADAMRAAVRAQIKTDNNEVALSLISELEQRVRDHLQKV